MPPVNKEYKSYRMTIDKSIEFFCNFFIQQRGTHMSIKKKLIKVLVGFILGIIICIPFINKISGDIVATSSSATYSNTSSGLTATNVQAALDELYNDCAGG